VFNIELKETNTHNLITIKGETTINYANDLAEQFKQFPTGKDYQLDCSEVSTTDVTFIQILAAFKQNIPSMTISNQGSSVFEEMLNALNIKHLFIN